MVEDGFPDWTELGQDSGLDPLGMQRPIEAIYQSLVPGISTITLRYRYYSFFPFILRHYEKNVRNADPAAFRLFQRRCEALYALICTHGVRELGVTGSDWAADKLAEVVGSSVDGIIDFSESANPEAEERLRYLRNKAGAFGAIYATQMVEMGLLHFPDKNDPNPNPVCSELALEVAAAFESEMGDLATKFFEAVREGRIALSELSSFEIMKPSRLRRGSDEHTLLANILLGKAEVRSETDLMRRSTLQMLLATVESFQSIPQPELIKWHWFENSAALSSPGMASTPELWFLYQACDLMRLSYEAILSAGLSGLAAAPRNRVALGALVEELADYADVTTDESWDAFARGQLTNGASAKECAASMIDAVRQGETQQQVKYAVRLVAVLCDAARSCSDLMERALSGADYFQSLRTEANHLDTEKARPAREVVLELIRDRVLKRHLWVASRKFRKQKAYTFHMEPEDGILRYRSQFQVSPSSPRIEQALRFLKDAGLIEDAGLTDHGRAELAGV